MLLGRFRVYREVFHSLFLSSVINRMKQEERCYSTPFTDKIQKGSPMSLRPHIQKAVKWSSDACLPASSPHTFCCLNDILGEGGQKVSSSVRTTQWKTLQLFHFIPLDPWAIYKATPCRHTHTHTHTHTLLIQHHTQALTHSQTESKMRRTIGCLQPRRSWPFFVPWTLMQPGEASECFPGIMFNA